ncbi:Transmembrane 6 superfamily member 2 [Larimichthys crocea]|uniref:Transmembrane 6 superfamily member 2 n=1 Tax=Larimichthys crocea TaxID=215358 RepID=A0A6G0IIB5_LARCR|nr:Transmembrane 6 superfamily member 2 [Larimichthys crocea]
MNNIPALQEPLPILGMGMVVLGFILLLLLLTVRNKTKVDPLFYVFAEFSFTCMVGLTNALEQDGFISGFMGFYLKMGEPHLSTAYAVMMSYWEGVVHFSLFLIIIHRMFKGKSYRSLGLLWAGSSIAHQIVLIPGVVIGKYGSNIRPAFWRNVPFFLVPFWAAYLLFSRPREMPIVTADKISVEQKKRSAVSTC